MKYFVSLFAAILLISCQNEIEKKPIVVSYPVTDKVDSVDVYFDTQVPDPYRWLEDDMSSQTEAWVKAQNKVTFGYLDTIPFRNELKERLSSLWNYEKVTAPFKEGDYTYFFKNDGLQNQYVVYRYKTNEDPSTAQVFLDPNKFKEDGTISLGNLSFSRNGKIAAYSISEGGSDWRKVLIMDAETKEIVEDTLVDIKFSGLSWKGNEGFYYSSYEKPIRGNTYPEAESELIKLEAPSGSWGRGIKLKSINLFNPKNISMRAKTMRRILVNVEFISDGF